jgi:hypothetical protein
MQRNDISLKRRILVDGTEIPGLVTCSEIKDEEDAVSVPSFGRTTEIKSGVKKFSELTLKYKIAAGTVTQATFFNWYNLNEYHDVTVVNTDANGSEIDRWLLRDCECRSYSEHDYDAAAVKFAGIDVIIGCTTTPVRTVA